MTDASQPDSSVAVLRPLVREHRSTNAVFAVESRRVYSLFISLSHRSCQSSLAAGMALRVAMVVVVGGAAVQQLKALSLNVKSARHSARVASRYALKNNNLRRKKSPAARILELESRDTQTGNSLLSQPPRTFHPSRQAKVTCFT
eukprot:scaffold122959_cov71-Phaeocystis_antarctica.AAC.4